MALDVLTLGVAKHGSITSYESLTNKPSINGVELTAGQSGSDLGLVDNTVLENYRTAEQQDVIDESKQSIIHDLDAIREGAAAGLTAVQPSTISDMATQTWVGQQEYITVNDIPVLSVNGKTGVVVLTAADLGIGSVFVLKGSVPIYSALPSSGNIIGDVYYVVNESVGYIWLNDGTENRWEMLGLSIDLSNYVTTTTLAATLTGYVEKVTGKELSSNDFTDAYKDKLDAAITSLAEYRTAAQQDVIDGSKQATLVSGTNIKTVNGNSILGGGNLNTKELPTVTTANNGNFLSVSNGTWNTVNAATARSNLDILNVTYPVGAIYLSVSATNPGTLFGGTWQQIQNCFLLAAGSSYSAGSTGGEATHTLTVNEMPSHKHTMWSVDSGAGNKTSVLYSYVKYNGRNYDAITNFDNTGGDQPHNNMPPYLAVYVWQRTA